MPPVVEGGATFPLIRDMADTIEPHLPPGFRTRLTQKPDHLDPGTIPPPDRPRCRKRPNRRSDVILDGAAGGPQI